LDIGRQPVGNWSARMFLAFLANNNPIISIPKIWRIFIWIYPSHSHGKTAALTECTASKRPKLFALAPEEALVKTISNFVNMLFSSKVNFTSEPATIYW